MSLVEFSDFEEDCWIEDEFDNWYVSPDVFVSIYFYEEHSKFFVVSEIY